MKDNTPFIAADGTVLTDELVNELAGEAKNGFANSTLEPVAGRPWETEREPMRNHAIRMPDTLWNLIEHKAKSFNLSASEYIRQSLAQDFLPKRA